MVKHFLLFLELMEDQIGYQLRLNGLINKLMCKTFPIDRYTNALVWLWLFPTVVAKAGFAGCTGKLSDLPLYRPTPTITFEQL